MTNLSSPAPLVKGAGSRILIILCFLFAALSTAAANPLNIVINEIAWMGTNISANDEWIELYNNTEGPIDLDGWQLVTQDGTPKINLSGTIPANGFYLLERTDDTTVPNVPADRIYSGALENAGETLELYDNFGNLIDRLDDSGGWSAGDNSTKQTMERKTDGNWQTSQNPEGTPKDKNSIVIQAEPQPKTEPEKPAVEEPTIEVGLQQTYPTGIVFNEILPSPEGPDAEEEWLEIFNQNDSEISLANWKISDTIGVIKTYTFPEETKILPERYLVLARPVSKITLNNEGDGLKIIQPDGKTADYVEYTKAPKGRSFNRTATGWVWSDVLTPGSLNKDSKTESGVGAIKTDEANPEFQIKEGLAAVSQSFEKFRQQKTPNSFSPCLIAAFLAVFSGAVIFLLKRLSKN